MAVLPWVLGASGWLAIAAAVALVIGAVVGRRDQQIPRDEEDDR